MDFFFNSAVADLAAMDFAEKLERGCRACLKDSDRFMTTGWNGRGYGSERAVNTAV